MCLGKTQRGNRVVAAPVETRRGKGVLKRRVCKLSHSSHVRHCDPADHQAALSMGFSRQEYWSG